MSWQVLNGSNCAQREHLLTTRLVKASDAAVLGRRGALDELDRRTHRACMDACEATSGCAAVTILKHVANFRTFAALCYLRRHFTKHQTSPRFWVTNTSACVSRSAFDSYMLLNSNATSDTATTANTVNAGGGGVFFSWRPRRGFWDASTVCEARTNAAQWLDERRRQAVDRCVAPSDRFDDCADCHRVPMGTAHRALLDAGWALNRSCPLDFCRRRPQPCHPGDVARLVKLRCRARSLEAVALARRALKRPTLFSRAGNGELLRIAAMARLLHDRVITSVADVYPEHRGEQPKLSGHKLDDTRAELFTASPIQRRRNKQAFATNDEQLARASKRFMLAYSRALAAADFELFWEDQVNPRCLDVPLLHSHMPCLAISDPSCLRPLARLPLSNGSNSASASSHCGAYSRPTARAQPSLSIHPQLQHLFAHSSA